MRRVATIGITFTLVVGLAARLVVASWGEAALAKGRDLYPHRLLIEWLDKTTHGRRPDLVWLGDSTLMDVPGLASYPSHIQVERLQPLRKGSLNLSLAGLDLFAFYTLMGQVLDLRPALVVMIADLRVCLPGGGVRGFTDFAGLIPAAELARAVTLPIAARGLTAPRLLLARLLDTTWGEWIFLTSEGLRSGLAEAPFWDALGPSAEPRPLKQALALNERAYTAPLTPGHPLVRFAGEAARMATARGVPVLVLVTPIPWEWLARRGAYDRARIETHIAALGQVVEANGGTLLDLHRALSQKEFRDVAGHFGPTGVERMSELVWPAIEPYVSR